MNWIRFTMRALLRNAIVGLVGLAALMPAAAEEVRPENRPIANAGFILKRTYLTTNGDLQILSPDAAVLTGKQEGPVLIARTGECTFEIKSRNAYGYRINFRLMTDEYSTSCGARGCNINVVGVGPVGCLTGTPGRDQCSSHLSLSYYDREDGRQVLATLDYMHQQCPGAEQTPAKPRY